MILEAITLMIRILNSGNEVGNRVSYVLYLTILWVRLLYDSYILQVLETASMLVDRASAPLESVT